MARVAVVSGFIEISNHPRTGQDYSALGKQLEEAIEPYEGFFFDSDQQTVGGTWLAKWLHGQPNITHSIADNAEKNSLNYHEVQHEKFQWLSVAGTMAPDFDFYVWIDYGILHVPGVTAAVIKPFLDRVEDYGGHVRLPGCWPKTQDIRHDIPWWRFCGGLMCVPKPLLKPFTRLAMALAMRQIAETHNVEWEVNTLARLELTGQIPILWYKADHNETMFCDKA
jgi:hypothetical protein